MKLEVHRDMDSPTLRELQNAGWERAYFRMKDEAEGWKHQWQTVREELENALKRIQELEHENEHLREDLAIARKVPPWVKPNKSKEHSR